MKRMIGGMVVALALVMVFTVTVDAGRRNGPGVDQKVVEAFDKVIYFETFVGGRSATVLLDGDGATDLDIFVYNQRGQLVAWGNGPTDIETLVWTPTQTETFRIEVHNLGNTWNRYVLKTN